MPYFDHNATTPLLPAARAAWLEAADTAWHNPSSPYRASARVHRLLESARARIAAIVGSAPESIVFNSGATEANNAVAIWAARHLPEDAAVWISPAEHPSALESARAWLGRRLRLLRLDAAGRVDVAALDAALAREKSALVIAMAANNETGVLNPVGEIAEVCRRRRVFLAVDSSQWIGKLPAAELPAEAFLIGCAHKFGGPKGTGFLRLAAGAEGFAGARGGAQEHDHRAGTEDYSGIAAMVAALEVCEAFGMDDRTERMGWRDAFIAAVRKAVPGVAVVGEGAPRLWNTVSLTMPRHENTRWVTRLDRLGFEVSTGSACATASAHPSHVLAAMGLSAEAARRTIRVSAGWETTEADWKALAAGIAQAWADLEAEQAAEGDGGVTVIEI